MKCAGVILAAGASSRFGGQTKQRASWNGKALVAHVAQAAFDAGLDPVIVVLGHESDAVRAALTHDVGADRRLVFVHCDAYGEGMAESLKTGIAALPGDVEAAFVLLADMPFVTAALIGAVRARFDPLKIAAAPVFRGLRGNPALVSRRAFVLVSQLRGDRGLGPLLTERADEVVLVEMDDDACLRDIDTQAALEAASAGAQPRPA